MAGTWMEQDAKRMRIYIGDSDQWLGLPLHAVLLEQLKKEGLAGATVFRGVAGFGSHAHIHTAAILDLAVDLPILIEAIDDAEKIQHALETIAPLMREGLITIDDVTVMTSIHRDLRPLPVDRHVGDIMTKDPVTARVDHSLVEAWQQMLRQNIKALPVVDDQNKVVGLLTHEDLLDRAGLNARLAVAQRLDEETLQAEMDILNKSGLLVEAVMSRPPITILPGDSIGLAAARLVEHKITRLPVVNEGGKLLGMVSRLDILRQVMPIAEKENSHTTIRSAGKLAGEIMTTEVPIVGVDADLPQVIASFLSSGEHRVIVVDTAGTPVGLISDSDVIGRIRPVHRRGVLAALRGLVSPPAIAITAGELMSPGAETIPPETPVLDAIHRMVASERKWLVVVDPAGKPAGLIDREIVLASLVG